MPVNLKPTNKVAAGPLAGALVAVGLYFTNTEPPATVVVALTTITLFVVQWFVKD